MKILKNLYSEDEFENLEDTKKYYLPNEKELGKEDYIGSDYEADNAVWKEYRTGITGADSLEELAAILNRYTDMFGNGSEWIVRNI